MALSIILAVLSSSAALGAASPPSFNFQNSTPTTNATLWSPTAPWTNASFQGTWSPTSNTTSNSTSGWNGTVPWICPPDTVNVTATVFGNTTWVTH
ncbi:hypothetical protein BDV97DRAFT_355354 [Delphinella strobiligena]|nr:hypothetical protein BDV97DRAFT_355354 [Delphinella strobiligena]